MNKDQRKYLTDWVSNGFKTELEKINKRRYDEPSLNNYLVAAALDGSLRVKSAETIAEHVKQTVVKMSQGDVLVTYADDDHFGYSSRKRRKKREELAQVSIPAEVIFEIPAAYTEEWGKWRENERICDEEEARLEGTKETVLLKVNIGSDKALEEVIAQADTLATLDLVNRQLTAGTASKGALKE